MIEFEGEKYYSKADVSKLFQVQPQQLERAISHGIVPDAYFRVGRSGPRMYSEGELPRVQRAIELNGLFGSIVTKSGNRWQKRKPIE